MVDYNQSCYIRPENVACLEQPMYARRYALREFIAIVISGYVTDVLDDAKIYSSHAGKKDIDSDDIKLAVECKLDHSFTSPPPKHVMLPQQITSLFI